MLAKSFLLIFTVGAEDVAVTAKDTMSRRNGRIVDCFLVGILCNSARNVLKLQDIWGWLQETWLLNTELSMTELSSSYYCGCFPMFDTPVDENMIGEVM